MNLPAASWVMNTNEVLPPAGRANPAINTRENLPAPPNCDGQKGNEYHDVIAVAGGAAIISVHTVPALPRRQELGPVLR